MKNTILTISLLLFLGTFSYAQQDSDKLSKTVVKKQEQVVPIKKNLETQTVPSDNAIQGSKKLKKEKREYTKEELIALKKQRAKEVKARQAKYKKMQEKKELKNTTKRKSPKSHEVNTMVRKAKEKLEKDKKEGKINAKEYQLKKERIEKAEKAAAKMKKSK